jgi:hypothetical protein
VAEAAKKLLTEGREDKETRDNLGILSTSIVGKLTVQLPQAAAPAAGSATTTAAD